MNLKHAEFANRCRGSILGAAFGDALGLPVEGMTAEQIEVQYGVIDNYLPVAEKTGRYSDDTQLTLATCISLVRRDGLDPEDCARSCADLFDPERGYGRSAIEVFLALKRGHDYRKTGKLLFPEGSFGNGAAMRIAPIGLIYGHLLPEQLRMIVKGAVLSTHIHAEAVDGALLMALIIGRLSRLHQTGTINYELLFAELTALCLDKTMRSKIELAWSLLVTGVDDTVAIEQIGCGVRSSESVTLAIFLAARYMEDAETAIIKAVQCGGDTDTIAAMVGALVGARHGDTAFPDRWHAGLERGSAGYETLLEMSEALAMLAVKKGFFIDFCL